MRAFPRESKPFPWRPKCQKNWSSFRNLLVVHLSPLLISLLIFIKSFRGPQYLQLFFPLKRDFQKAASVQAGRDAASWQPNMPLPWLRGLCHSWLKAHKFPRVHLPHRGVHICLRSKYTLKVKKDRILEWEVEEAGEVTLHIKINHWILELQINTCLEKKNGGAGLRSTNR